MGIETSGYTYNVCLPCGTTVAVNWVNPNGFSGDCQTNSLFLYGPSLPFDPFTVFQKDNTPACPAATQPETQAPSTTPSSPPTPTPTTKAQKSSKSSKNSRKK